MDVFILNLLNSPAFQMLATTFLSTVAVDASKQGFRLLNNALKDKTHEKQLLDCLEKAFFETERNLHWKHDTEAIYETFFGSLMSFSGSFDQDSLTKIFKDAVGADVTDKQISLWIENVKKQISLEEHTKLREYLLVSHILRDSKQSPEPKTNYILTPSASIYDNPEIICRDEFVDDLLQMLSSEHKRIQITGMGGLGKTETLSKLFAKIAANKQITKFDHIAFIRFSGDILSDIESQIDYQREYMGFKGIEAAKRFLHDICTNKNVLLCIDDIRANQEIVRKHDPAIQYLRTLGASVMLAARAGFPDFKRMNLKFLSTKACIEIFEKKYGGPIVDNPDIEVLTTIIEKRAGNHTLIINRLGNMAKDYGWSISVLADRLEEKDFDFQKGIADEELLQQEINKLYQVNDDLSEAERNILEAFSIFPAAPLSADLCVEWLHEDASLDIDACAIVLNRLAERTWLEKRIDSEGSTLYVMHPLVQAAIQEQTTLQYPSHSKLIAQCNTSLDTSTELLNFEKASSCIQFAVALCPSSQNDSIIFAKLAASIGRYYYESAVFNIALEWYLHAKDICEKILGYKHLETTYVYSSIAQVYGKLGEFSKALEWFEKDLAICEAALGENHYSTATTYNNIAEILNNLGIYDQALELFLKSLAVKEKTLEKEHLDLAASYNNIAVVYQNKGEYEVALSWFSKALPIVEIKLGPEHPKVAATYNNIAAVYFRQGNIERAYELYMKALRIREKILGKEHPDTAASYSNLGLLLASKEKYQEALSWHMQAIAIFEKVFGRKHPDTATSYNNVAFVYAKLHEYENALNWHTKALFIREELLGLEHPDTAITYNNIAGLFFAQGQHDESLVWFLKALHIREKILGQDHPDTAVTLLNIAGVCYYKDEYVEALSYCEKALEVFELKLGNEHLNTHRAKASKNEILKHLQ